VTVEAPNYLAEGVEDEASLAALLEEEKLLEAEIELKEGLPHLYGFPWYEWAWDFFTSMNPMAFLCAANQISKSSTQIRKCIDWATDVSKWKTLWPRPGLPPPNQFWYVYPTGDLATAEFETKWVRDFLPRGKFKDHPQYGWKVEYKNKQVHALRFNSGVIVFFKSYKQGGFALQAASVYAVFLDEECPIEMFDEFVLRVNATDGYISMVFTATLGQDEWRRTIEPKANEDELYPNAWKRQVALWDCQFYRDGTPSPWTQDRINRAISRCSTPQQVQRRIEGRFVKETGLIFPEFSVERHLVKPEDIPESWSWWVAADIGSGKAADKKHGHPGGIVVMAVSPDFRKGRVVRCWRGDRERTTAGDIYNKAEEIIAEMRIHPMQKLFDWGSADFATISARAGGGWSPANKKHEDGQDAVNTLFKNDMLAIFSQGENGKLAGEFSTVSFETPKNKRKDDLCDPTRYICLAVPWDWTAIKTQVVGGVPLVQERKETPQQEHIRLRRGEMESYEREKDALEAEFAEINALYEGH
jgi:phage terminase large subunit-like protein